MTDEQKYKVIAFLEQNYTHREIADELDISIGSVIRFADKHKQAKIDGTISQLLDYDKLALEQLANNLPLHEEANNLVKNLSGLDKLQNELQLTAIHINNKAKSLVHSVEYASDLLTITKIVCDLQSAFFSKDLTQVNVQNNYGDQNSSKYGSFLSDVPKP